MRVGLIVPVYKNFEGFAELMHSVDEEILPIIIPNWKYNYGVSAGWNRGIVKAIENDLDHVLVCNDDIILEPGTLRKLHDASLYTDCDLVTPVNIRDTPVSQDEDYTDEPDFSCFMIRPAEFKEKFGFFDEGFTPAYFEDNDMAYRIKLSGGKAVARTDAGIFHKGSVTQNWGGQQVVTGPMFLGNKAYYIEKWGGEPRQETFERPFNQPSMEVSDW